MPGNQTQSEINDHLNETVNMYAPVFQWVGRPKVEPIDVKIERWVKLVQQKPQSITLQYNMLLRKHFGKQEEEGVVSPLLESSHARG